MEVNMNGAHKRKKAGFKFNSASDDILLNIHHTAENQKDGTVLRIRFTAAGFSANNERLIAVDHRENVVVFDLVRQQYWLLSEQLKKITVIEGLSDGNVVACGNKEGMVFIVDLDQQRSTVNIKAHHGSILRLARSPDPSVMSGSKSQQSNGSAQLDKTVARYLLVTSQQSASVYLIDGLREISHLNYGLASINLVQLQDLHWFLGASNEQPFLIGHSASGIIRVYRPSFKLIKELNVLRLIELYLKNGTTVQTIEFIPTPHISRVGGVGGDAKHSATTFGADEVKRLIKRITEASPNGPIKATQLTEDGRYYTMLCSNNTLAFVALDSWLVCRVVALSNLFITRYAFLPNAQSTQSVPGRTRTDALLLLAQTVDNDLWLVNFGPCNIRTPPAIRPVVARTNRQCSAAVAPGKCYKFRTAPNGRMLANVLKSGEVLLHNLDAYLQSNITGLAPAPVPLPAGKVSAGVRLQPNSYGKRGGSASSSSSSSGMLYLSQASGRQRAKIERQMSAIHSEIAKALPKERLLRILKEYGEYPAKHRATIWRTLLDLPADAASFGALLQRGLHPCVASYDDRFPAHDARTVRALKKVVSCLAHWCPVFGLIEYLPLLVLPFVRTQHPNDALAAFETVATVLLNQCQLWFEFAPLEPFNYLAMVENVLAECEPRLMGFYRSHGIAARTYTLPLMQTGFSAVFPAVDRWACLWDHVLSNDTYFPVFLIAAYSAVHRGAIMGAIGGRDYSMGHFFQQASTVDVRRVLRRAYDLMDRCPDAVHPRHYFKPFIPLSGSERQVKSDAEPECRVKGYPHFRGPLQKETAARDCNHAPRTNAIDADSPYSPCSPSTSAPDEGSSYVNFCNFPQALTEVRCTETASLQAEQRRLEAKIIELEALEHSLKERAVNNLIRQEHEQRVKKVERTFEEAIGREEQRIEMQRKLLLLHRKQLRERESALSLDLHNAKLINDATVREQELETLLKTLQRERQREETDLLFAEEDLKLREQELMSRYQSESRETVYGSVASDGRRPEDQRYHRALEQLAVQKQKLYDEIDRTYTSLGMPAGSNEYTYRTVTELRKVASDAGNERYRSQLQEDSGHRLSSEPKPSVVHKATSQVKLYEDAIQRMEAQVKVLQRLKNESSKNGHPGALPN